MASLGGFILVGDDVLGGLFAINGEITIGNIAEFVIYVNLLTWPANNDVTNYQGPNGEKLGIFRVYRK